MATIAIIGGTGLDKLPALQDVHEIKVDTPYGATSNVLKKGRIGDNEIIFLPRHGENHSIAPHEINYRANIWALKQQGVTHILAINAVGGISEKMSPEKIVFPDQIIDYTHSRQHTFSDEKSGSVLHIDFTYPYSRLVHGVLRSTAVEMGLVFEGEAVYGATQGPRLESIAEINRMHRDGCDIVGMTGMPEAALARELDIEYACCALVVNWAAGKGDEEFITMEIIEQHMRNGMIVVARLIANALPKLVHLKA
ncbi:MAG: S-methyl-5'-thioinosine phosphorylase [Gammaproteobacteria bacterium]|nr:S-methyl-5'-thioinosine phosphorylase [Gammaproteobacteria bacterium]